MRLATALALLAACSADAKPPEGERPPPGQAAAKPPEGERPPPGQAAARESPSPVPRETTQLLLALVPGWDAVNAEVRRFERTSDGWRAVGAPWPAVIGVHGAAWGRGLHGAGAPPGQDGPLKREGDGRSPAGVFALGGAYGYDPAPPRGTRLSYRQVDRDWLCIDDPASARYNQVLDTAGLRPDWRSFEPMRRADELYRRLIVVEHNPEPAPGGGSCIFLHLWHGAGGGGTAGCTAMAPEAMDDLLAWLDPAATPVYVLLPRAPAETLRTGWRLP
jgi:L,D-peptidoglycan transpeptidase YkuD (ErfK/YbiS/YcfS/YnhG family)